MTTKATNLPANQLPLELPESWLGLPFASTLAPMQEAEKPDEFIGVPMKITDVMFNESDFASKKDPDAEYAVIQAETADKVIHMITCGGKVIVRQLREITSGFPQGSFQPFIAILHTGENKRGTYYYFE